MGHLRAWHTLCCAWVLVGLWRVCVPDLDSIHLPKCCSQAALRAVEVDHLKYQAAQLARVSKGCLLA